MVHVNRLKSSNFICVCEFLLTKQKYQNQFTVTGINQILISSIKTCKPDGIFEVIDVTIYFSLKSFREIEGL